MIQSLIRFTVAACAILALSSPGAAQNLEKLQQMKTTGTSLKLETVPQTGKDAEDIVKNLERIKLPTGFKISLYAIVPDARHMAVGPNGVTVFIGTRKTQVWAVTDRKKRRVADEVKPFAPAIDLNIP